MMFWTRSAGIVDCVCVTGIVLPDCSTLPSVPGWQSMKYSPISDCGRDWQNASEWNWPKPLALAWTVTTACSVFWSRSIDLIEPAITPATLKSAPFVSPNALSSWILYVGLLLPPPDAPSVNTRNAPTASSTAAVTRILLMGRLAPDSECRGNPRVEPKRHCPGWVRAPSSPGSGRPARW